MLMYCMGEIFGIKTKQKRGVSTVPHYFLLTLDEESNILLDSFSVALAAAISSFL